jgi:putative methionine-R-sulfoxide reductase with GAF domain
MTGPVDGELTLFSVRRMMEGVVPPSLCTVSPDGMPNAAYLSLAEYVDPQHVALSFQFFNHSRENVLATRRACLTLDDPYTGAGVVLQLEYVRTETEGPTFERIRAKLAGIASHAGMEKVFVLRGADIYRVLELRRVPGRKELPAALPRCDLAGNSRVLSERMARCTDLADLLDTTLQGLDELLKIDHSMLWILDPTRNVLTLLASRGYPTGGTGAEIPLGEGLAGIAAEEGVPIRVGHMMGMQTYGRAARARASEIGVAPTAAQEIPLPGLARPRSQLAVPLRARGHVLGVLFVESLHDQYFGYDDEDALMLLCGQLAVALTLMTDADAAPAPPASPARAPAGAPVRVRRYAHDNSIFLDDQYLIKGVAGAVLWKIARDHLASGRCEFTNRELRLAPDLRLPDVADNLEVRLVLLQRRLEEHGAPIRVEKTGRGRFRLALTRPLALEEIGG